MKSLKSLASTLTVAATLAASSHAAFAATPTAQQAARAAVTSTAQAIAIVGTSPQAQTPTTIGSQRITARRRSASTVDPLIDFNPDYSRALTPAQFDAAYQAEFVRVFGRSFP